MVGHSNYDERRILEDGSSLGMNSTNSDLVCISHTDRWTLYGKVLVASSLTFSRGTPSKKGQRTGRSLEKVTGKLILSYVIGSLAYRVLPLWPLGNWWTYTR